MKRCWKYQKTNKKPLGENLKYSKPSQQDTAFQVHQSWSFSSPLKLNWGNFNEYVTLSWKTICFCFGNPSLLVSSDFLTVSSTIFTTEICPVLPETHAEKKKSLIIQTLFQGHLEGISSAHHNVTEDSRLLIYWSDRCWFGETKEVPI